MDAAQNRGRLLGARHHGSGLLPACRGDRRSWADETSRRGRGRHPRRVVISSRSRTPGGDAGAWCLTPSTTGPVRYQLIPWQELTLTPDPVQQQRASESTMHRMQASRPEESPILNPATPAVAFHGELDNAANCTPP